MKRILSFSETMRKYIYYSFLLLNILSMVFIYLASDSYVKKSVENRAITDLQRMASMQVTDIRHKIYQEYRSLSMIGSLIDAGMVFEDPKSQNYLKDIVQRDNYCMLAVSDLDGNPINYKGEQMVNISDREYFRKIALDRQEMALSYLEKPVGGNSPRFIFSMPLLKDGEIYKVLFCSKETSVFKNSLFGDIIFSGDAGICIIDSNHKLLADNDNITDFFPDVDVSDISDILNTDTKNEDGIIVHYSKDTFLLEQPLDINDWSIICIVRKDTVLHEYKSTIDQNARLVITIAGAFLIVFLYAIAFNVFLTSRAEKEKKWTESQIVNAKTILNELNCAVVDYNISNNSIDSNRFLDSLFKSSIFQGSISNLQQFKEHHPEFSFNELEKSLQLAISNKEPVSFNTLITIKGSVKWLYIMLIPVFDVNRNVTHIIVAIQNVTKQHHELDSVLTTLSESPGGIHRCYLGDPIHLEYASDSFLKMLDYSRDEFNELIGPDRDFAKCIAPEDRDKFEDYIAKLADTEMTDTITYHLVDKHGRLIFVSDTMESKRNSEGIMYGYSAITDVSEHFAQQNKLIQELEGTKEKLSLAHVRISTSQMQPHFLYNALSSIREVVLDDPEYASDLIYNFTIHLRACIKSMTNDDPIPFSKELENIKAYVAIEKMRFGNKLDVRYEIETDLFPVIPLGIQPLVENSIRHGLFQKGAYGGSVIIRTMDECDSWVVEVVDDGVGFDLEQMKYEISTGQRDSTGIFNLIYRFKKILHADVDINSIISAGTTVRISIPKGKEEIYESNNC